ncbi:malonyl-CoA O-methyltransferase [Paenibacillus sp. V4I3]|uniref:malonyl-ACP O-methyltransferase BioC n=1 Tax=unclassified Paenibacillus TaxID=185978 RepID=UPI002788455C|nr:MULTISPECIES: malonyl-ACP O-methyltransferase BioC [unclassified Paenibacillus]MDQ0877440.1 malonyl-CoA O-methyltransferase [Paenibacillus sp. V4I3]MDQ0886694.1 malonyl-CoA O-methyltransferase [Paenibacillus sp. V4I9]
MIGRKTAIGRQFNRSATGSYDIHAHVQRIMAKKLLTSLEDWTSESDCNQPNILEIGCGTGTLTEMVVNHWSCSSITALDIAPAMIEAAEQRVRSNAANFVDYNNRQPSRVNFVHADAELWAASVPSSSFNLIVSNACFQWLSCPIQTLEHLYRLLHTGSLLAFATFGPDTFRELHTAFDAVYRAGGMEPQRHGLSFQTSDQWKSLLKETGFSNIQCESWVQTEVYASARDFLLSVKAMGASTSEAASSYGFGSRRLFANMYKEYEDKFSTPGGVAATYEVLIIRASVI